MAKEMSAQIEQKEQNYNEQLDDIIRNFPKEKTRSSPYLLLYYQKKLIELKKMLIISLNKEQLKLNNEHQLLKNKFQKCKNN